MCSKRDHKLGDQKEEELKKIAEMQSGGIRFKRVLPFYETFNAKIDQMLSSGLVKYWKMLIVMIG